jgi:drug/metabolite transporter (DMT)-like permease
LDGACAGAGEGKLADRAPQTTGRGIAYIVAAMAVLSTMDTLIKWLAALFPVMQIYLFRALFALIPIMVWVAKTGGLRDLRTDRFLAHVWRSIFGIVALVSFIYALRYMPLTDAVAIGFSAPLMITALSSPLLGERVSGRRWAAVVFGFIGVLVMVRPGSGVFDSAALIALISAFSYALGIIAIRRLVRTESTPALVFYLSINGAAVGLAAIPFGWVWPSLPQFLALLCVGLLGGVGQLLLTAAYRLAPVAVIAPFDYSAMLFVTILGYLVFGEFPDATLLVGAAIVVMSGLMLVRGESRAG